MLGPYEIEIEGRTFFGNVALREFHIIDDPANTCIVDVERPAAHPITPRLAAAIRRLALDPGVLIPEPLMAQLRGLGLVAGEDEDQPAAPKPSDEAQSPSRKPEFPVVSISLFLAQECNMRCVYCYGQAGEYADRGMMDESTAFKAVEWLVANSGSALKLHITFFGGEPLLNFPLLRKVVAYAKQKAADKGKEITFGLTTNGSLLTDEVIAFLKEEKINPLISFDGPPDYQNRQRPFKDGSGSYDRVRANVQKLRGIYPSVMARATLLDDADPFAVKEGVLQAGFTSFKMYPASPVLLSACPAEPAADGAGKARQERMVAFRRREAEELLVAIRERRMAEYGFGIALQSLAALVFGRKRYYCCTVGKTCLAISVNGDIYPCHRFTGLPDMRQGNIVDYVAGEINDYHRAVVNTLPACRSCYARNDCGGGCFYHNKSTTGDIHRPEELYCQERKADFEAVVKLYCQLDDADKEYVKAFFKEGKTESLGPEALTESESVPSCALKEQHL